MFPPPIWNNSNNDSLDILELSLKTSTQNSFHELNQKQERDKSAYYKYNCDCILRLPILTANYLISDMKEQPITGVTSLFFLSSVLMKNGYYAELRD